MLAEWGTGKQLESREEENWLICSFTGEFSYSGFQSVRSELDSLLGKPGRDLVLDLSGVPTIDSTGVSILTRCHVQTQRQNRQCILVGAGPALRQVFDSMNLGAVFCFADSLEAAKQMKGPC